MELLIMLAIHALVSVGMSAALKDSFQGFLMRLVAMLSLGMLWFSLFNY